MFLANLGGVSTPVSLEYTCVTQEGTARLQKQGMGGNLNMKISETVPEGKGFRLLTYD